MKVTSGISTLLRLLVDSYRKHWLATPASALAALISTLGAACLMLGISPVLHATLESSAAILTNALVAPLFAYVIYLQVYYYGMFWKERGILVDGSGKLDRAKLKAWFRVVRYDYIAHVPTDIYLISLAGIMQAALESSGTPIFWAVILSQFVDDFITYLKEPAIWSGAKGIVAWEDRSNTTLRRAISKRLFPQR